MSTSRGFCVIVALAVAARVAQAQRGALFGTVFDSVANVPLAGARVEVAPRAGAGAPRTAIADGQGRYRIDSLPPGDYLVGFYHDALTTLGLDALSRAVTVASGDVNADLAIPSSASIRTLRCGERSAYAAGMLVGSVRDAQTRGAISGVTATIEWRAFAMDSANYRVVREVRPGTVEGDGVLLVCGLPLDAPLDVVVTAPNHRPLRGTVVTIPKSGIGRLDLVLVDSGLMSGTAVIRGRVTRENGKAVTSGRVTLPALAREAVVRDGDFTLANIPAGSWVVRSAVIGVEPQDVMVTASDSAVAVASVVVPNASQRLDAVTVMGKRDRNLDVLDDVLRRSRVGSGTVFLPGHPALRSAIMVGEVMKEARGFRFIRPDSVLGRLGCKFVTIFVDDMQLPDGFTRVDQFVDVKDVLAIEAYPDISIAPVRYRYGLSYTATEKPRRPDQTAFNPTNRACAVVAIWTRRRF